LQPAQVRRRGRGRPVEETGPVGQPVQLPGGGRAGRLRPPPLRGTQPAPQLVGQVALQRQRSEEYTSELQSQSNLVCRLLLEKKNYAVEQEVKVGRVLFLHLAQRGHAIILFVTALPRPRERARVRASGRLHPASLFLAPPTDSRSH